ncbi:MAG: cytochrome C oxidase subunit IV family protein [Myxococcota bacterium]
MVSDSHQMDPDGKVHAHITPAKFYWAIFGALIFFTVLTVAVSYVHLGPLNLVVAIAIATAKASLVVLYFMHMKYETKFNVLVFLASLLFMGVFLAYTMNDTDYRADVDAVNGGKIDPRTGRFAYGTPEELVAQVEAQRERDRQKAMKAMQPTVGFEGEASPTVGVPAEELGEDAGETAEEASAAQAQEEAGEGAEAASADEGDDEGDDDGAGEGAASEDDTDVEDGADADPAAPEAE